MVWPIFSAASEILEEYWKRKPLNIFQAMFNSVLIVLTLIFIPTLLFFCTKGGFYDTEHYTGNGSAHGKESEE